MIVCFGVGQARRKEEEFWNTLALIGVNKAIYSYEHLYCMLCSPGKCLFVVDVLARAFAKF